MRTTKVEITKSCNQDWNKMEVVDNCKFCSVCEKNVIDFTASNKYDILDKLKTNKEVCGRIKLSQIREINSVKSNTNFFSPKWAFALSLGTVLGFSEPITAQTPKEKVELREKINDTTKVSKDKGGLIISGLVVDNSIVLPLPGVNVNLKGTNIRTLTNFDGEFSLEIPVKSNLDDSFLVFDMVGFNTQIVRIDKSSSFLNIRMEYDETYQEVMVVTGGICAHRTNIFKRIGGFFSKLFGGKTCH